MSLIENTMFTYTIYEGDGNVNAVGDKRHFVLTFIHIQSFRLAHIFLFIRLRRQRRRRSLLFYFLLVAAYSEML